MSFREAFTTTPMSPPWLVGDRSNGQLYMATIGTACESLLEKQDEGISARLPGQSDPSLIPYQAADRVLVQGTGETNAQFIARMKDYLTAWSHAGSRASVLGQLQAYLTGVQNGASVYYPEILIVGGTQATATWDTVNGDFAQGAPPNHADVSPSNWTWDSKDESWRSWLVVFLRRLAVDGLHGLTAAVTSTGGSGVAGVTSGFATVTGLVGITPDQVNQYIGFSGGSAGNLGVFQITSVLTSTSVIIANPSAVVEGGLKWGVSYYPYIGPGPVWGSPSFVWGQNETWGLSCSSLVVDSIRNILSTWKSAQAFYPRIIFSFGGGDGTPGNEFSPNSAEGAGNPDGTWGTLGKTVSGVVVPGVAPLNGFTAFADGTGVSVQCYEKNRS